MLAITVLEHPPFPCACPCTPAHAVPLPCVSPRAECDPVLNESNPMRHRDDLTFTQGRHGAVTPLWFCIMSEPFNPNGLTFPWSTCPQVSHPQSHTLYVPAASRAFHLGLHREYLIGSLLFGGRSLCSYSCPGRSTALKQD